MADVSPALVPLMRTRLSHRRPAAVSGEQALLVVMVALVAIFVIFLGFADVQFSGLG